MTQGSFFDDENTPSSTRSLGDIAAQVTASARQKMEQNREAVEEEAARLRAMDEAGRNLPPEDDFGAGFVPEGAPDDDGERGFDDPDNVVPLTRRREKRRDGRGDFFAIDHRLWAKVCGLGLNAAVAYLVMARGTGGDNRTTSWSANAIRKHTGIGPKRAGEAIDQLIRAGLVRKVKDDGRPRYQLAAANNLAEGSDARPDLDQYEEAVLRDFQQFNGGWIFTPKNTRYGKQWSLSNPYKHAVRLAAKGYLRDGGGQQFQLITNPAGVEADEEYQPDWTWLPNSIVDGAADEPGPLERIRQTQSLVALRIFVDLYHTHDLVQDGGVSWKHGSGIRHAYDRLKVGQQGPYIVWGFKPAKYTVWGSAVAVAPHYDSTQPEAQRAPAFWKGLGTLEKLKLVEPVAHLVESSESSTAEIVHPLPAGASGEEGERAITAAAAEAGRALVTEGQWGWALDQGVRLFVPVDAALEDVAVVGVFRLRYRPRTLATSIWYAGSAEWAELVGSYEAITGKARGEQNATSREIKGHQG